MEETCIELENELEKHHFAYFVGCCGAFIKHAGILEWEVSFQFLGSDSGTPRASTTIHDRHNRLASIQLYDSWDRVPSEFNLWKTAFHEVMELLLSDLHCLAQSRCWDYDTYDSEHHRVIRTLEKVWFEEIWKNGHDVFNFQSDAKGGNTARPALPKLGGGVSLPNPEVRSRKRSSK